MSSHQAKFTWGAGPNSVFIAGNFNNWSDHATPLTKLDDGTFAASVELPWGEKQAFKYVVDGEWKVREDEAKEWDAAGNMNNVYTAPHAPAPAPEPTPAPAAAAKSTESTSNAVPAAAVAAVPAKSAEPAVTEKSAPVDNAPPSVLPAKAAEISGASAAADKPATTQPSTLLSSSAPKAASAGDAPLLGAPVAGSALSKGAQPVTATAAVPVEAAPATTDPTPVKIEQAAANANIGQAPTANDEPTLQERAAEYGAGALGVLGAAVGGAVAVVERATGIDLAHGNPLTVEEAKARGIDVNSLPKTEVEAHATSPVGTKPPATAVDALVEKTEELKLSTGASNVPREQVGVPLPNGKNDDFAHAPKPLPTSDEIHSKHDLPAQNEQADKHKEVPAPVIKAVSPKDPKKDRSLEATHNPDSAVTKPIDANPSISAAAARKEAETQQGPTGSTPAAAQGKVTSTPNDNLAPGETYARPDAPNANKADHAPSTPVKDSKPASADAAVAPVTSAAPVAPVAPVGSAAPHSAAAPIVPVAPATPAKDKISPTAASTPASTPAKSTHVREETGNSDIRKRKSSFFTKIKHAFSPKDKEKK